MVHMLSNHFLQSLESTQTTNHYHTKYNLLNVDVLEINTDWNKWCDLDTFMYNKTEDDLLSSIKMKIEFINAIEDREGSTNYNNDYDGDNSTYESIVDDVCYCYPNTGSLSASECEIIETTSCNNDIAKLSLKNGESRLVLAVSNYFENYGISDSVNINFTIHTCGIEVCSINTYTNNITGECTRCGDSSSYACCYNENIGSTTLKGCQECPNHRRLKGRDNISCTPEECQ